MKDVRVARLSETRASESERADGLPPKRRRTAYIALALATAMAVLDGSIANTALPTIARDLHADVATSVWIVNGFQLAITMSLFAFASLGRIRGARRVYGFGVGTFVVGSLLCALAHSLVALILARVVQGFGAAAIMAIAPALLRDVFPRADLGRALGVNAVVIATSAAAGPTLGGSLLAIAPWPFLFAINVPFGLANLALNRALPKSDPQPSPFDWPSAIASGLGFALAIWGFDGIGRDEAPWSIAARIVAGVAALGWFARRQFAIPRPMIDLDLFAMSRFSFAAIASFSAFVAQGLAYVALPFAFQEVLARTPLQSGLLLTSWPLTIAFVAPIAGRLSDRYSAGVLSTIGLATFAVGLASYGFVGPGASSGTILVHGILCGLGFGFFQSPNNRELIGGVPRAKTSSAAALLAALRVGGQTVGTSLVAILFGTVGASVVGGSHPAAAVAHAAPVALWSAAGFAGAAALASGLRLVRGRGSAAAA